VFKKITNKTLLGLIALAIVSTSSANADVVAFGLTMGKSSESDLKSVKCKFNKEKSTNKRISTYTTNGSCYKINGLKKVLVTFVDKKVKLIDAIFNKDQFNTIKNSLENKYGEPSDSEIPFVGDTFTEWQPENENLLIRLDAPHLSFDMELFYINDDYLQELTQKKNNSDNINSKQRESVL
jgi:hypothetical protein